MKRLLSALALSALFFTTVFALPYPDLDSYYFDFEGVYQTHEMGIFSGYDDGTFGGELSINRAELAKVLVLSTGLTEEDVVEAVTDYDGMDYFTDVNDTEAWYFPYIRYMQIEGWVQGYDDGSYGPGNPVLVSEGLKMVTEVLHGTPSTLYADTDWYDLYVNYLVEVNVLDEPSSYNEEWMAMTHTYSQIGYLGDEITRSKIAELLWRLQEMEYEPLLTFQEMADADEIDYQVGSDSVEITDYRYSFSIEVPLGDFDFDELRVYRMYPSGAENDYTSSWQLMYPDEENYMGTSGYTSIFGIAVYSPDYFVDTYGEDPDLENYYMLDPVYGTEFTYNTWCAQETPPALDDIREAVCTGDGPMDNLDFEIEYSTETLSRFATCLEDEGTLFYGAYWCPHCEAQKELFGDAQDDLPYVECYPDEGDDYAEACTDAGITAFPTWIFGDGSEVQGQLSLEMLEGYSSCSL